MNFDKANQATLFQNKVYKGSGSIRDLIGNALEPARSYRAKVKKHNYKPKRARFKAKFYFRDGNEAVFYSWDTISRSKDGRKFKELNEEIGLFTLHRLTQKYEGKFITCMIWLTFDREKETDNSKYNYEVCKYIGGKPVKYNPLVTFRKNMVELEPLLSDYKRKLPRYGEENNRS